MLRTVRGRLIASHVGLIIILIPLLGVALTYVLESQVVLVNLSKQLTGQAVLVGELLKRDPEALVDPERCAAFVAATVPLFPGELSIFDMQGRLLASSDPPDPAETGDFTDLPGLSVATAGEEYTRVRYSARQGAEVVEVLVPIYDDAGAQLAIIRITDHLSTAQERFSRLRVLVASVLAVGMLVGAVLGLILALTVERPLGHLTHAVESFGRGDASPLHVDSERGPEEVRMLARAFQGMGERIHRLEQNRRYLLSNIIHELGRPLGAMRAADRALLDGAGDDADLRSDLLRGIDGEIGRMEVLLDELAGLRDLAAGRSPLRKQAVALSVWLPQLLAPWREAALAAGLTWTADIPHDLPAVQIDPARLGQALGNLLSNAVKYTPAPGAVRVTASAGETGWQFQVADTGPGVPEAEQDDVFEPFYRTPPDRYYPQGLGLGLPIARDLIRAHGGEVILGSCEGAGACFTVRLPLGAPQPGAPDRDATPPEGEMP